MCNERPKEIPADASYDDPRRKHFTTGRMWKSGVAKVNSAKKGGAAKFSPLFVERIAEYHLACVRDGTFIANEKPNEATYCMEFPFVVGVSDGVETHILFAIYDLERKCVHGYPVTREHLQRLTNLGDQEPVIFQPARG